MIRGKGSVKEGKVGRKDGQMLPGEDEPLHALVTANTMENVKKAVEQVRRPPCRLWSFLLCTPSEQRRDLPRSCADLRNLSLDSQHSEARHRNTWRPERPEEDAAEGAGQTQRHAEGRRQQVRGSSVRPADCCRRSALLTVSVSSGFCAPGRTQSPAASPTPPCVQSVAEQVTSPLTASTPGADLHLSLCWWMCLVALPCSSKSHFAVCSSFAAHRTTGGEPPQSAQDKARMDKEYLSLMAELGEAPVPSSGGHSSNQGGAPRASGPNSSQPPAVSRHRAWFPGQSSCSGLGAL